LALTTAEDAANTVTRFEGFEGGTVGNFSSDSYTPNGTTITTLQKADGTYAMRTTDASESAQYGVRTANGTTNFFNSDAKTIVISFRINSMNAGALFWINLMRPAGTFVSHSALSAGNWEAYNGTTWDRLITNVQTGVWYRFKYKLNK
jgi:hypothetical protein